MSAEWQRIGGIEVCEGTDGCVGIVWGSACLAVAKPDGSVTDTWSPYPSREAAKEMFEKYHCQPRHRLIECADGAVMVLSVDEVDGKPRRVAMVVTGEDVWHVYCATTYGISLSKNQAIAVAVAYVTAR